MLQPLNSCSWLLILKPCFFLEQKSVRVGFNGFDFWRFFSSSPDVYHGNAHTLRMGKVFTLIIIALCYGFAPSAFVKKSAIAITYKGAPSGDWRKRRVKTTTTLWHLMKWGLNCLWLTIFLTACSLKNKDNSIWVHMSLKSIFNDPVERKNILNRFL